MYNHAWIKDLEEVKFMKKNSFTMAEVLITLGIIGIIAALTIPGVMSKYRKVKITAALKKDFSIFQQAIRLSEAKNGDFEQLPPPTKDHDANSLSDWWDIYMKKEFPNQHTYIKNNWFIVDFADGSGAGIKSMSKTAISFQVVFCVNLKDCLDNDFNVTSTAGGATDGKNSFTYLFEKGELKCNTCNYSTRDELINNSKYGCKVDSGDFAHRCCGSLICQDGWEIKNDYPVKI